MSRVHLKKKKSILRCTEILHFHIQHTFIQRNCLFGTCGWWSTIKNALKKRKWSSVRTCHTEMRIISCNNGQMDRDFLRKCPLTFILPCLVRIVLTEALMWVVPSYHNVIPAEGWVVMAGVRNFILGVATRWPRLSPGGTKTKTWKRIGNNFTLNKICIRPYCSGYFKQFGGQVAEICW